LLWFLFVTLNLNFELCIREQVKSKSQLKKEEKLAAKAMKKEQFKIMNVSVQHISNIFLLIQ